MYVSELRALAEFCKYGAVLDYMLCDRLVCGINDKHIQQQLLSETDLTLAKALDLAQSLETAAKNTQTLKTSAVGASRSAMEVHKVIL